MASFPSPNLIAITHLHSPPIAITHPSSLALEPEQIINQCGRLPVALKAVAAMVADGLSWRQLLVDFHDGFQLESFAVRYIQLQMRICTHLCL